MELDTLIGRTQAVRDSLPLPNVKQRMAQTAQELSRAGDEQARVELLNEALLSLVSILYVTDPDQRPANYDPRTWRLLVPAPWGARGWAHWELRKWEGEVLRRILMVRAMARKPAALFDYNEEARTWHINVGIYPAIDDAFVYLRRHPISLTEWATQANILRTQAHQRMNRKRGR